MPILQKLLDVRGAISFKEDNYTSIESAILKFFSIFLSKNKLKNANILSVIVVAPPSLKSCYPCSILRKNGFTFPCITVSDILVDGTPQNILRFLIRIKSNKKVEALYLEEAENLLKNIDQNNTKS